MSYDTAISLLNILNRYACRYPPKINTQMHVKSQIDKQVVGEPHKPTLFNHKKNNLTCNNMGSNEKTCGIKISDIKYYLLCNSFCMKFLNMQN